VGGKMVVDELRELASKLSALEPSYERLTKEVG